VTRFFPEGKLANSHDPDLITSIMTPVLTGHRIAQTWALSVGIPALEPSVDCKN
jgi:hypothetical protein